MRKEELSPPRRELLTLMQKVNYGRISNLSIVKGEPVLSRESTIERVFKLGAGDICIDAPTQENPRLRKKTISFFEEIAKIGDGIVRKIEIRGGQPILMQIEEKII